MTEVKTGEENASNPNPAANEPAVKKEDAQPDVAEVATQLLANQEELLTRLEQSEARAAKAEEERDNYKQGMLGAKSKIKKLKKDGYDIDDDDEQDLDGIEDRIINKIVPVIQTQIANAIPKPAQQGESEIDKLRRTNQELALALKNRAQPAAAGASAGNSQEAPEPAKDFWTPEQLAALKARGLDPEEVKKRVIA